MALSRLPRVRVTARTAALAISAVLTSSPKLHHIVGVGPTSYCRAQNPKSHFPFCTSSSSENGVPQKKAKIGVMSMADTDLPEGLVRELMPKHVALILDGNKRWAELKGLGPESGHDAGLHALLEVMGLCAQLGIKVATFFLFSSENWRRPKGEIDFVMWRFQKMLVDELDNLMRQGIRISTIGNTTLLPNSLQEVLEHTEEATKNNTNTHVMFAISYSGQDDITQACQSISKKVRDGLIEPKDITKSLIEQELETKIASAPCPDLLIRTSGELRISNFLLWQLAYSELYFTKTLWPDFGVTEFIEALQSFQQRGRRFGGR